VALVFAGQRAVGDPVAASLAKRALRDPYGYADSIRDRGPLLPGLVGHLTTDHALVDEVLRDHRRFGSTQVRLDRPPAAQRLLFHLLRDTAAMGQGGRGDPSPRGRSMPPDPVGAESMIGMDPPDHTRLRRLVSRAFTPRAVERLRPGVEATADRLLDRMAAAPGPVDLVDAYAGPLPIAVIGEMFGIAEDDRRQLHAWGDALAVNLEIPTPRQQAALDRARVEFGAYLEDLLARRRRAPGDRIVDHLLAAGDADDAPLTHRELLALSTLLLVAGFETTVNLIGNAVSALLLHPAQRRLLVADPSLLPGAVEEVLRWDPPVQRDLRYVREPTQLAGHRLERGERILMLIGGANRDPTVFTRPHAFDVTRRDAGRHLSFGVGVHHCLGAGLARMEGQVALARLLARFPHYQPAGPGIRRRGRVLRGFTHLPLDLGPESA
jgi:hypothetical protein